MSSTKKIAIQGKSALALLLLLFFSFSAFAKGFTANVLVLKTASHSKTKTCIGGKHTGAVVSVFDVQDDNDADDVDFAVLPDFSIQLPHATTVYQIENTSPKGIAYTIASFHLYDLYCNWKSYLL